MGQEADHSAIDAAALHDAANLVAHQVQTGDSLQSLAKTLGCRWQDLALLNWGTDDPDEINWYLEHFVGCTHKSGANFYFTSDDRPGIIYLPAPIPAAKSRLRRGPIFVSRYPIE